MSSKDEQVRAVIADQASEWFAANDAAPLGGQESAALVAWLKASPVHVGEFLAVATIARDLHALGTDPEAAIDTLVARALADADTPVQSICARAYAAVRNAATPRWRGAAVAMAALAVVSVGLGWWNLRPGAPVPGPAATALEYATRHGEQRTYRLADNSVLHLNTDTAVTVRYSDTERVVVLSAGEADFEVAHEPKRAFRVLAGPAAIVDLGTKFDVWRRADSTLVTVVAGRVAVEPAPQPGSGGGSGPRPRSRSVQLGANQQLRVADGQWPATPVTVDAQHTTAWLHRQIVFDREPLERVAAEFNRYAPKPIEISAAALRDLEVSGTFSIDDAEEFLAFLRSLEGVRVEVTATQIRVSQK